MNPSRLTLLLVAAGLSSTAWAESATLTRASDLKAKPFTDATTVVSLAAETKVQILVNDGGWTQVKTTSGQMGWVRLLNVRPDTQGDSGSGIGKSLGALGNVARTGSTGTTATTGTKGITKDDLERASPNFAEVKKMDQYKASTKDAERFAAANRLKAREMDYLETGDGQRN